MLSADAVSAGPLHWEDPALFVAALLGAFLVALFLMLRAYDSLSPILRLGVLLAGVACGTVGLLGARWVVPVAVNYFEPTSTLTPPLLDQRARNAARASNRPMLYYFRADWCRYCPDFERYRLMHPDLSELLGRFVVVKMDLTEFSRWKKFAEREYGVHGTPSLAFRDRTGRRFSELVVEGDDLTVAQIKSLLLTVYAGGTLPAEREPGGGARHSHP